MEYKLTIIICSDTVDTYTVSTAKLLAPYEIIIVSENKDMTTLEKIFNCKVMITSKGEKNKGYVKALREAKGNVFLSLSGGLYYHSSQLTAFLQPIKEGRAQVVLNNLNPSFSARRAKQWPDSYTLWRQVFNDMVGQNEMHIDSLLSTPNAFTKQVVESIGYESFENLAVAHMRILGQGWVIDHQFSLPCVFPGNFFTPNLSRFNVPLTEKERSHMEQYFEALWEWHKVHGLRGNYHDGGRRRDLINYLKNGSPLAQFANVQAGIGKYSSLYNGKQLSIVIPAQNEENTIEAVINEAKKIEPFEIIVVNNGSTDRTGEIAKQLGAMVITIPYALGWDVGRSIGALAAKGDILLFIDADFPIPSYNLAPFCHAIANGADVALNNLNLDYFPLYVVNLYKYLLNIACGRKELGVGSMVAVPHAVSRSCLEGIGWDSLVNPCLAHVKAILQGYKMENVHFVNVMSPNRIRDDQHVHIAENGHPKAVLRINGDHIEALIYMLQQTHFKNTLSYG